MTALAKLEIPAILQLRQHLSIVHHVPGRIRLRLGPALWGMGAKVDRERVQTLLDHLQGIRNVRLNAAVASVTIEYDHRQIPPADWQTLLQGDTAEANELLQTWLERYAQLLSETLNTKE